MQIIGQVEWRGMTRPSRAAARRHPAPGVELHHTDSGRADTRDRLIAVARSIYRDHVGDRGWRDVFYGYLLGDNEAIECRGYDHLSNSNGTVPHMTVCLVGNYSTGQHQPTPEQLRMIAELRQYVVARGGGSDLTWHSRRDATTCPGGNVIVQAESMLRRPFPGINLGTVPPAPAPHPTPAPVPAPGDDYAMPATLDLRVTPVRGRHVDNLQGLLLAAGYGPAGLVDRHTGRPDGIAGPLTQGAVTAFQRSAGLKADTIVGPKTWRALIER